jgi:hypothetical protein
MRKAYTPVLFHCRPRHVKCLQQSWSLMDTRRSHCLLHQTIQCGNLWQPLRRQLCWIDGLGSANTHLMQALPADVPVAPEHSSHALSETAATCFALRNSRPYNALDHPMHWAQDVAMTCHCAGMHNSIELCQAQ